MSGLLTGNKTASAAVRDKLLSFISPEPNTGCWLWAGSIGSHGYGQMRHEGTTKLAHRLPAGLDLDHLCRVRSCCNPDHLEPVTRIVNARRGMRGLMRKVEAAKITHCPAGHEYTHANTYHGSNGRSCRACARARTALRRAI